MDMKTKIKVPLLILGLSIAFLSACDGGSEDVNLTENEIISSHFQYFSL